RRRRRPPGGADLGAGVLHGAAGVDDEHDRLVGHGGGGGRPARRRHRDHRVHLGRPVGEELVLEDRGGEAGGGGHGASLMSIAMTVMLSWPPWPLANSTRRVATSGGSPAPAAAATSAAVSA